jgi:hypothetical protein
VSWILPTPGPVPNENPPTSALAWETTTGFSGPSGRETPQQDTPILGAQEGRVTHYRTGPGDLAGAHDSWLNPDIFVVGREGVENGRGLFVGIPGPPPEGHGGYDPFNQPPKIDHSTRTLAIFASDWNGIVQQQQMRGEHVVIMRVPPGSVQGYMPTDPGMVQANNARNMPSPWDTALTVGAAATGS